MMPRLKPASLTRVLRLRLARVYETAANYIVIKVEERACFAIAVAMGLNPGDDCHEVDLYVRHVLCGEASSMRLYPDTEFGKYGCSTPEADDARVVALCLMATLVLAGEVPI